MKRIDRDKVFIYGTFILLLAASVPLISKLPRSRGKNPLYHAAFVAISVAVLVFVPGAIQNEIFSPGGVVVIGTLLPVYESIRAACTVSATDDRAWLQFWIGSASFCYATEFIDDIKVHFPKGGEHWYEFEFLFILWMMFPLTDGATLIFEKFTEPYVSPFAMKLKHRLEGWVGVLLTVVNTTHLTVVWFLFMSFPEESRRFAVVAAGTIYPLTASIISITTKANDNDETFWLTYWSTFSLLYLAMDYLENFVGGIRGFYSLCLAATLYLFLPMFGGANVVFRKVLVPLTGQYENMLLRDIYLVRMEMEKSIPESQRQKVFTKAADLFMLKKD